MSDETAVVILNDHLHDIEKDPEFGSKVAQAIRYAGRDGHLYTSGFSVLPTQHADTMQIVGIGGNTIRKLGYGSWAADNEQLLRDLARDLGFRIVRLPLSPTPTPDRKEAGE